MSIDEISWICSKSQSSYIRGATGIFPSPRAYIHCGTKKKESAFPLGPKYDSRYIFHAEHDAVGRFSLSRRITDLFGLLF